MQVIGWAVLATMLALFLAALASKLLPEERIRERKREREAKREHHTLAPPPCKCPDCIARRSNWPVADWRCTRCGALKNGWVNPPCQTEPGEECPMVPVNACGDVLPFSAPATDHEHSIKTGSQS